MITESKPRANIGSGIKVIADFFGMSVRKAYYLASKGALPGVFRFNGSRGYMIDFNVAAEALRSKAKEGI